MADNRTPAAWLDLLSRRMDDRWARPRTGMGLCDAYYEGDHRLAFATSRFRQAFGHLFGAIADNWMQLVVEASVERLEVQGFRFGKEPSADSAAWDIWQANGLDGQADMVHTEAVKLGEAYWQIGKPESPDGPPRITMEHPSQCIVACDPGDPRRRLAALKKWMGEDGYVYANVYLPEGVAKFRSQEKPRAGSSRLQWVRREDDPGEAYDFGEVPIIPVRNQPQMVGGGRSDLLVAIPVQDALNKLLSDLLIGSEYQAFPQRVLLGVETPMDPVTQQPVTAADFQLKVSQESVWLVEDANAKVAQFDAANLDAYVKVRDHLAHGLNAKTRTPPHYVLGEIVNVSGDALTAAEAGLVSKTRRKMRPFGEAHEDAMRLAFKAIGDTQRAATIDAEVIWRNPEWRSEAQAVDAALKMQSLGIPNEMLWERVSMSPQDIDRAKTLRMMDQALGLDIPLAPDAAAASQSAQNMPMAGPPAGA